MRKRWFIVVTLFLLLILTGFSIYEFKNKPQMTIIVTYPDVPPIIEKFLKNDITVYYRGLKVGKVSKVGLSEDQKQILFYLVINYKNLKLPRNIDVILKTEDLFAARYFSISYPKNPTAHLLADGDKIKGTAAYERLDKYLMAQFETGKIKIIMDNLVDLTNDVDGVLKSDNSELMKGVKKYSGDVGTILANLREIIQDPQVKRDIKSTLFYSSRSIKDLSQMMESEGIKQTIATAPESINKTINNLESLNKNMPQVNDNVSKANYNIQEATKAINKVNSSVSTTNCNLDVINSKIPTIPQSLINNADKTLIKFDCYSDQLTDLMNKQFWLFRFLLGKPGSYLEKCKQDGSNCCK